MSNITECYENIAKAYETLFELRLMKKTANSEEQKKEVFKAFKTRREAKKKVREMRIAIANILKGEKK